MKGPGLRLLVDVRRTWKCPRCGYEEHVGAEVTTVACPCCPGVAMRLSEHKRVYADELAKLRSRPRTEAAESNAEPLSAIETEGDIAPPADLLSAETLQTANDSQQIPRRKGARPHKQSRRGQHKQQQQHSGPSPESEGENGIDESPVNQTPPESPDDPAPADT